eukprot:TRINITY_DN576_c0_g1_i2.p1 TRINITY_DN576_c0_g1~~TRINITY_DN576_c0_g1_i2.p1  ORF type:complete len:371 (-),score=71.19 TRINITY_DN576_c0_g1_i2:511-1563(-)
MATAFRKLDVTQADALTKNAISITETQEDVSRMRPGQTVAKKKKLIEVPYTEVVQVPVNTKVLTKGSEERTVTGKQLVPVKKFKDVKETVIEYKDEVVKGMKEVWVKKEVPYETIVRKPIQVVKTKRVPYTDYEEKEVVMKVTVPCDRVEVQTGFREDKHLKTKLVEVEQDLFVHHGPVVVREGTPRVRDLPGGANHGCTERGKQVIKEAGPRLRTNADRPVGAPRGGEWDTPRSSVASFGRKDTEWNAHLKKPPGDAFGLKFDAGDGEYIKIQKVKPGLFMDAWNKQNPQQSVKRGDKIVAVNGVRGNAKKMMDLCTKSTGDLRITFQGSEKKDGMIRGGSLPTLAGTR